MNKQTCLCDLWQQHFISMTANRLNVKKSDLLLQLNCTKCECFLSLHYKKVEGFNWLLFSGFTDPVNLRSKLAANYHRNAQTELFSLKEGSSLVVY